MTQQPISLDETNLEPAAISGWPHSSSVDVIAREAPVRTFTGCHNTGIHHVGLRSGNPAASAEFYRDLLGMKIVGGTASDHPLGASAFLSSRPDEESHEIALLANPDVAHTAFKVSSLSEFRSLHALVAERNIPIKFTANLHVSFAFYFGDPDGNIVEVYWPTGDSSKKQPQMEPLDLSQPDDVLLKGITPRYSQSVAICERINETAIVNRPKEVTYVPARTRPSYRSPMDQITFL